jgi:hypothetical protein
MWRKPRIRSSDGISRPLVQDAPTLMLVEMAIVAGRCIGGLLVK